MGHGAVGADGQDGTSKGIMSREQAFDLGGTGQSGRNHGAQDQDQTSCVLLA